MTAFFKSKGLKVAKVVLITFLVLETVYFVGTYVFLNSGSLTGLINTKPEEIQILYDRAYSFWPGKVEVRGFRLRIQDSGMQLSIHIKKASTGVHLRSLLQRTFYATSVDGEGIDFLFRNRREAPELTEKLVKSLPPIEGLPSLIKKFDLSDEGGPSNPWKIRIENIHLTALKQIWFEEFQFLGNANIDGGFYLHPQKAVEIFPTKVEFTNGNLTIASAPFLNDIRSTLSAQIDSFSPNETPGLAIFKNITAQFSLKSDFRRLDFLNYYLSSHPSLHFHEGKGAGDIFISMEKGILQKTSRLKISLDDLKARVWRHYASGKGSVEWKMENDTHNALLLRLNEFLLKPDSQKVIGSIEGPQLVLNISSSHNDLTKNFSIDDVGLNIKNARLTDLRYWNSFFPRSLPLKFKGGHASLSVDIFASGNQEEERDKGKITLDTEDVVFDFEDRSLRFSSQSTILFNQSSIARGDFNLEKADFVVRRLSAQKTETEEEVVRNWQGEFSASNGALHSLEKNPNIKVDLAITGTNALPILFLFNLPNFKIFPGFSGVLSFPKLEARAQLSMDDNEFELTNILATGKSRSLEGWIKVADKNKNGNLLFAYGPFAIGAELNSKDVRLHLENAISWFDKKRASKD